MPAVKLDDKTGLRKAVLYVEDYDSDGWGWWCPACSTPQLLIMQEDFKDRDSARRAAAKHEARRGHR